MTSASIASAMRTAEATSLADPAICRSMAVASWAAMTATFSGWRAHRYGPYRYSPSLLALTLALAEASFEGFVLTPPTPTPPSESESEDEDDGPPFPFFFFLILARPLR